MKLSLHYDKSELWLTDLGYFLLILDDSVLMVIDDKGTALMGGLIDPVIKSLFGQNGYRFMGEL